MPTPVCYTKHEEGHRILFLDFFSCNTVSFLFFPMIPPGLYGNATFCNPETFCFRKVQRLLPLQGALSVGHSEPAPTYAL